MVRPSTGQEQKPPPSIKGKTWCQSLGTRFTCNGFNSGFVWQEQEPLRCRCCQRHFWQRERRKVLPSPFLLLITIQPRMLIDRLTRNQLMWNPGNKTCRCQPSHDAESSEATVRKIFLGAGPGSVPAIPSTIERGFSSFYPHLHFIQMS